MDSGVWERHEETMRLAFGLTHSESRVARECIKGTKNIEIAKRFGISPETVNKHLDRVYRKAKVRGRAELAAVLLMRM